MNILHIYLCKWWDICFFLMKFKKKQDILIVPLTMRGMLLQMMASLNTVPPRIFLMVPLGDRYMRFSENSAMQYNFFETLSTYFYIQRFINIVQELNISSLYKLIKAFTANKNINSASNNIATNQIPTNCWIWTIVYFNQDKLQLCKHKKKYDGE